MIHHFTRLILDIKLWMEENFIRLNQDKTEVIKHTAQLQLLQSSAARLLMRTRATFRSFCTAYLSAPEFILLLVYKSIIFIGFALNL